MTETGPATPGTAAPGAAAPTAPESSGTTGTSFRLVYRSRHRLGGDRGALGAIFLSARSRNREVGVTGALLVTDDRFVQTLEGDEDRVREIFERITRDTRHDDVVVLQDGAVDGPVFSRWAMAQVDQSAEADIPLLADKKRGVVRAAGHPTTPEQDALLDVMREAARS